MARYIKGKLRGKVGNVVGVEVNGQHYFRKLPNRTAPPTEAELKNRFLLELVATWLRPITPFVRQGFRNYSWNFEGFSAAFSVVYKEALQKNGFDSFIDPALVKLSSGNLGLPQDLQASLVGEQLQFTWSPAVNSSQGPRDKIMMLAYDPVLKEAFFEQGGAIRYQGHDQLSLSEAPPGTYHLYAAFVAEDGSRQSESGYLGSLEL